MRALPTILAACLLSGCATGYHESGIRGGYSETQLANDMFEVSFSGNGYTSDERASDLALLRCAEIATQHGCDYFIIVSLQNGDGHNADATSQSTTDTATAVGSEQYGSATTIGGRAYTIAKPSSRNTMIVMKAKPSVFSYESAYVIRSIRSKYKL
jgi:hypothetical protein